MRYRKRYIALVLLLLVTLVASACGGGDDEEDRAGPTPPSFPTATLSTSQTGTPSAGLPTAFPTPSGPTPTRFAGFPTLSVPPTIPATYPNQIQIVSPVVGQQLAGNFTVFGSASHPEFIQYALEFGPSPNPSNLWYPITPQPVTRPVINNALGAWNTTLVQDGSYQVRLHVWLTQGRENTSVIVSDLRVRNTQAPPPPPNNTPPSISPIAPLNMQRGTSATIALGIFDREGDPTTFIATSDNTSIAAVTPSGQAITVFALRAGIATIRIRVTDNRGGTAETSFLTTVVEPQQPNNPPNITPIPSQTITQGAFITIPVTISDPDAGDTVTFVVLAAAPTIVRAEKATNNQSIFIAGLSPGTTTITLTATDSRGQSRSIAFTVAVNPPTPANNPPSIGTISGQTLEVGQTVDITLSISDPDAGDTVTYTPLSSAPNVAGVSDIGSSRIRLTGASAGSANVTVTVRDSRGATASTVFSVSVNAPPPPNQNPTLAEIANQTVEVGNTINVDLTMSDPDNDTLTFSSNSDNTNTANTGQVDADTLSITGVAQGTANITVSVGDGRGGSATRSFRVTVNPASVPNNPPTLDPINSQTLTVGQSIQVTITFNDPDGDQVSVFANSDTPGVAAATHQQGTSVLNVTGVSAGSATITVEINDGRGGEASRDFLVTVNPPNQNPVINTVPAQSCDAGDTLTVTVSYSDPDNNPITVTPTSNAPNVATASLVNTTLTINCLAEGNANITLTANDDRGGSAATSFAVTVGSANQNPVISDIGNQTCDAGAGVTVSLSYSDPDGDTVSVNASSSDPNIATADVLGNNVTVNVACISAGTASITVSLDDGQGGSASDSFQVTVNQPAPVNQNPSIQAVGGQTCQAGDTITVNINANDPDGDTLSLSAVSDNSGVASASMGGSTITITCAGEGFANVTVSANDGRGGTATISFGVTVSAPPPVNQNPTINPVGPQTCEAGSTTSATVNYSDPDGDSVSVDAVSDNSGVASASVAGSTVNINCSTAGIANITLNASDGRGGTASTTFSVTVNAPPPVNQNPSINPVGPQTCNVGDTLNVTINFSDPDGDSVAVTANSDNSGVASATVAGNSVSVSCSAEGFANITLNADDGRGGTASTTFGVTVSAVAPPPFDVTVYPEIPDFGALESDLAPIYNNGVNNLGRNPNAFSVVGDDSINGPGFMDPIALGQYNLGNFGSLQDAINYFQFTYTSVAIGSGWTPSTLLNPSAADPGLCQPGETPLACELRSRAPVIMFISFAPNSANSIGLNQFITDLETVVTQTINSGTIPVLVTLPNDGTVDAATLAQFNEAIVELADTYDIPLWNLYNTMQGASNGIYATSPGGAADYSDASLAYGVNRRGLAALRILDAFRTTIP